MNSKQRRKQKRRFGHVVEVSWNSSAEMVERLGGMLEWCHLNYGRNGYSYRWEEVIRFSFPCRDRAVEFKLRWADGS